MKKWVLLPILLYVPLIFALSVNIDYSKESPTPVGPYIILPSIQVSCLGYYAYPSDTITIDCYPSRIPEVHLPVNISYYINKKYGLSGHWIVVPASYKLTYNPFKATLYVPFIAQREGTNNIVFGVIMKNKTTVDVYIINEIYNISSPDLSCCEFSAVAYTPLSKFFWWDYYTYSIVGYYIYDRLANKSTLIAAIIGNYLFDTSNVSAKVPPYAKGAILIPTDFYGIDFYFLCNPDMALYNSVVGFTALTEYSNAELRAIVSKLYYALSWGSHVENITLPTYCYYSFMDPNTVIIIPDSNTIYAFSPIFGYLTDTISGNQMFSEAGYTTTLVYTRYTDYIEGHASFVNGTHIIEFKAPPVTVGDQDLYLIGGIATSPILVYLPTSQIVFPPSEIYITNPSNYLGVDARYFKIHADIFGNNKTLKEVSIRVRDTLILGTLTLFDKDKKPIKIKLTAISETVQNSSEIQYSVPDYILDWYYDNIQNFDVQVPIVNGKTLSFRINVTSQVYSDHSIYNITTYTFYIPNNFGIYYNKQNNTLYGALRIQYADGIGIYPVNGTIKISCPNVEVTYNLSDIYSPTTDTLYQELPPEVGQQPGLCNIYYNITYIAPDNREIFLYGEDNLLERPILPEPPHIEVHWYCTHPMALSAVPYTTKDTLFNRPYIYHVYIKGLVFCMIDAPVLVFNVTDPNNDTVYVNLTMYDTLGNYIWETSLVFTNTKQGSVQNVVLPPIYGAFYLVANYTDLVYNLSAYSNYIIIHPAMAEFLEENISIQNVTRASYTHLNYTVDLSLAYKTTLNLSIVVLDENNNTVYIWNKTEMFNYPSDPNRDYLVNGESSRETVLSLHINIPLPHAGNYTVRFTRVLSYYYWPYPSIRTDTFKVERLPNNPPIIDNVNISNVFYDSEEGVYVYYQDYKPLIVNITAHDPDNDTIQYYLYILRNGQTVIERENSTGYFKLENLNLGTGYYTLQLKVCDIYDACTTKNYTVYMAYKPIIILKANTTRVLIEEPTNVTIQLNVTAAAYYSGADVHVYYDNKTILCKMIPIGKYQFSTNVTISAQPDTNVTIYGKICDKFLCSTDQVTIVFERPTRPPAPPAPPAPTPPTPTAPRYNVTNVTQPTRPIYLIPVAAFTATVAGIPLWLLLLFLIVFIILFLLFYYKYKKR